MGGVPVAVPFCASVRPRPPGMRRRFPRVPSPRPRRVAAVSHGRAAPAPEESSRVKRHHGSMTLGSLQSGEATALVEIMAMLEKAPTEALPEILEQLRGASAMLTAQAAPIRAMVPERRKLGLAARAEAEEEVAYVTHPVAAEPTSAVMRSGRACVLRHILLSYFRKHAPGGVSRVETLVARVVGGAPSAVPGVGVVGGVFWTESELFAKLEAKYGAKVDLDPQSANDYGYE